MSFGKTQELLFKITALPKREAGSSASWDTIEETETMFRLGFSSLLLFVKPDWTLEYLDPDKAHIYTHALL